MTSSTDPPPATLAVARALAPARAVARCRRAVLGGGGPSVILLLRLAPLAVLLLGAAACGLTPATGPPTYNRGIGGQSGA